MLLGCTSTSGSSHSGKKSQTCTDFYCLASDTNRVKSGESKQQLHIIVEEAKGWKLAGRESGGIGIKLFPRSNTVETRGIDPRIFIDRFTLDRPPNEIIKILLSSYQFIRRK